MEYKFFDKQFLVMPDDKDVIGKKVFFSDNIHGLIKNVENGKFSNVGVLNDIDDTGDNCYFDVVDVGWNLAYYDPNYECKVAYYRDHKQIQYFNDFDKEWVDTDNEDNPAWNLDTKYRVKPEPVHEPDDKDKYVPYASVAEMLCDHFKVDSIEDIKDCIWVRLKADTHIRIMIMGTDVDKVLIGYTWMSLSRLFDNYIWDDYTAISK